MSQLNYLTRNELQVEKWDECVQKAENGLIYARSDYLDAMAENWDAVIVGDYEAVFPIPWKKKWGVKYMYPPFFTQQLGLIGDTAINELHGVLEFVRKKFKYGECYLNFKNILPLPGKNNFILQLQPGYDKIYSEYHPNLRYDLRKATGDQFQYSSSHSFKEVMALFMELYRDRIPQVKEGDFEKLIKLLSALSTKNELVVRTMTESDQLAAGIICIKESKRIYLIIAASSDQARQQRAMHLLIDRLIREFAGTGFILDFEGSDLPGVSHFYRSFGSVNQPYYLYKWNDLPFPLRLFKK